MFPKKPKLEKPVADDVALYSIDQLRAFYHDAQGGNSTLIRLRNCNIARAELEQEIRYRVYKDDERFWFAVGLSAFSTFLGVLAVVLAFMSWRFPAK